jgi:glycosyltransferase involved in cell wall biosynthesis
MAKPVIATPRALAGVEADRDNEVVVAESAEDFAAATLAVLAGGTLAGRGKRARARVLAAYDWDRNLRGFDSLLEPV